MSEAELGRTQAVGFLGSCEHAGEEASLLGGHQGELLEKGSDLRALLRGRLVRWEVRLTLCLTA